MGWAIEAHNHGKDLLQQQPRWRGLIVAPVDKNVLLSAMPMKITIDNDLAIPRQPLHHKLQSAGPRREGGARFAAASQGQKTLRKDVRVSGAYLDVIDGRIQVAHGVLECAVEVDTSQ